MPGEPQPRWITALATVPYSDLILSGSWDGWVRVWKVGEDKRRVEAVGVVGRVSGGSGGRVGLDVHVGDDDGVDEAGKGKEEEKEGVSVRGVINDIEVFERGERGKDGVCVVVAVGKEHRLGRWKKVRGRNGAVVFEVPMSRLGEEVQGGEDGVADQMNGDAGK